MGPGGMDFKHYYFKQLAKEVNDMGIEGINIDLTSRRYDPAKDALAYLVERYTQMYDASQAEIMLEGLVDKVHKYTMKDPPDSAVEGSFFIDRQVLMVYQAAMVEKIGVATSTNDIIGKKFWEETNRMYAFFKNDNIERNRQGKQVLFGGVARSELPDWYLKDHGARRAHRARRTSM